MKRLIKPLAILMAVQAAMKVLGLVLRKRYSADQVGENGVNAIGVAGGAKDKVTTQAFTGGYLRAVMGGVELDLTEAAIPSPPATIESTIVMGGAAIKVPKEWKVKVEAQLTAAGVDDKRERAASAEDASPILILPRT